MTNAPTRPLVVDLDGTVTPTDLLWESVCSIAASRPLELLSAPRWLVQGRAHLKRETAKRSEFHVDRLPFRKEVLALMRERSESGGMVVLATAADEQLARRVADHLGTIDEVIGSNENRNCKGEIKREAVRELLGEAPFDLTTDSSADLPLVKEAEHVWLVDPDARVRAAANVGGRLQEVFPALAHPFSAVLRLMRPHQWAKNILVAVPLLASRRYFEGHLWLQVALAAVCISLTASAIYIINDLCDMDSDRAHRKKKKRPLAAGQVSIPLATAVALLLPSIALPIAYFAISPAFAAAVGAYVVLTTAYSFWLKRKVFVDVLLLAGLYSYRIYAGGVAVEIAISEWLTGFSMFFFLSLALAKRYCELDSTSDPSERRGYRPEDLDMLRVLGPVSGYLSVLVIALYVSGDATAGYPNRQLLWLICPITLYWITRIWFLAHRKEMDDDPLVFALSDSRSLIAGACAGLVVLFASLG